MRRAGVKTAGTTVSLIGGVAVLLMLLHTFGFIDFKVCVAWPGECRVEVIHKSKPAANAGS
ncbi:hypothetical protein [Burkholderia stagnalis]|uniref:hypothetical protein n=1 Tax=Burkholderia stagnalis TaxID=1503054 RepID=UPI0007565DA9|nr:hypothetical protein [Burkholderia stagnalis]KVX62566.1 hypothetical protein WT33_14775 [Burkholderia stagnalis]